MPSRRPNASTQEVASFMAAEFQRRGTLYEDYIVSEIEQRFGDFFLHDTGCGGQLIRKQVLEQFARLTPNAVWSVGEKCWRVRQPGDKPGRKQK